MKAKYFIVLVMLLLLSLALVYSGVVAGKPEPPTLSTLSPGGFLDIEQELDINVVFIGYETGPGYTEIDEADFNNELPSMYRAINRFPSDYAGNEYLGLTFSYSYTLVYADDTFEDAFFGYLGSIAAPMPLTLYQDLYNLQAPRSLNIINNHWIDAPSAEQWLANNAGPMLGVDTTKYTIFFVNWFGRDDFKHHVYVKTDEPDPDTGYNFGLERESRKLIAWGGTTPDDEESGLGSLHRIWFYDLSAGPEGWTDNWNLEDDWGYRMPPVWEYGNMSGYRPFDNLSGDLGKVTRYVGIDLLFTTSPLYKPAISPPVVPEEVQLDITVWQIDPNDDGTAWFDEGLILQEISDLFLYHNDHLMRFLEGDGDYELPIFAFNATDELFTCCLGFADDNWSDGTQSFVFAFDSPSVRDVSGYGFSTTTIHEVGHHIGLSHPHDGYDYEADVDFGPGGPYYFAWSGDESNSMMSYIDLNWDFSQFDRDNMNRYMTSVYLNQANTILESIYKSPRAAEIAALLLSADAHAATALAEYDVMSYALAATHAKAAFDDVLTAAEAINVQVEPQAWPADYKAKGISDKFVDQVDYQRNKP
jgi:hypothetical protein